MPPTKPNIKGVSEGVPFGKGPASLYREGLLLTRGGGGGGGRGGGRGVRGGGRDRGEGGLSLVSGLVACQLSLWHLDGWCWDGCVLDCLVEEH